MSSLFDFSREISKLNKEKKYSDALRYFKDNKTGFTNEQISGNEYIIAALITALRHTGKYDAGLKFLELYNVQINENTKDIILSAYGWLLHSKFTSENKVDDNSVANSESDFFDDEELSSGNDNHTLNKTKIVEKIEKFLPLIINNNDDYSNSVFSNLFTIVLKTEKKKQNPNWKYVIDFCDLFQVDKLKNNCSTIEVRRKGIKKLMELASDKEYWFAYKSKALMKLGMFQECYDVSNQALETITKFHYSNDVWFARRMALSKKQLGNTEDAITELQKVLKRKKEWFIQKELAELYKEKGDNENSLKYAMEAINNHGDLEYKVDLLFLIGELLNKKQDFDFSFKHYSLSRLIRLKSQWTIPSKLISALNTFKMETIPMERLSELKVELIEYWRKHKTKTPERTNKQSYIGKIVKILHDNEKGKDGFIKSEYHISLYFKVNSTDVLCKNINIGTVVMFNVLPPSNGKKECAVNIRLKD